MLPSTCREICQMLVELGIEYKKIHSCKNGFILYRDEYQDKEECLVCKEKRYHTNVQGPTVPKKVLHHMPNFNDDEDDAGQDEDDDNINYLKYHMNIDNDTLDDIVVDNDFNDQDL